MTDLEKEERRKKNQIYNRWTDRHRHQAGTREERQRGIERERDR